MNRRQLMVFFDAECPFCVGWVKFLLDRDGEDRLRFAGLQSDWSRDFFARNNLKHPGMESLVVWDGEFLHLRSAAAIALAEALPGVWNFGRHLDVFPLRMRDGAYDLVARSRYRWFGKYDKCWVPKEADRRKFLDLESGVRQPAPHGAASGNHTDPDQRTGND